MNIVIGDFEQFDTGSFHLKRGETAELRFPFNGQQVHVKVRLVERVSTSQFRLFGENGYGVLEISEFSQTLGGGVATPTRLVTIGNVEAFFAFDVSTVGDAHFFSFQFYKKHERI